MCKFIRLAGGIMFLVQVRHDPKRPDDDQGYGRGDSCARRIPTRINIVRSHSSAIPPNGGLDLRRRGMRLNVGRLMPAHLVILNAAIH